MAINLRDSYSKVTWDLGSKKMKAEPWGKTDDTGRGIIVTIAQDSVIITPTTETLRMYFLKPDGTDGYLPSTIVNGKFIIENMSQVFAVPGKVNAELEFNDGTEFIKSISFTIDVYESQQSGNIVSSNDYSALQVALGKVSNLEGNYAPRLGSVESQLAENVTQWADVFSALDMRENAPVTIAHCSDSTGDAANEYFELAWKKCLNDIWKDRPARVQRWFDPGTGGSYQPWETWQSGVIPGKTVQGQIFADSFATNTSTILNLAPDVGSPYTEYNIHLPYFSVVNNRLVRTSGDEATRATIRASLNPRSNNDFKFTGIVKTTTATGKETEMMIVSDTEAVARVYLVIRATGNVDLVKFYSAAATVLGTFPAGSFVASTDIPFELSLSGLTLTGKFGGNTLTATLSQTEADLLKVNSKMVLRTQRINTEWDNLVVEGTIITAEQPANIPQVSVYNGGAAGKTAEYQRTNLMAMYPVRPDLIFINHGHNYSSTSGWTVTTMLASIQSFVDELNALHPSTKPIPVVVTSQNPQFGSGTEADHLAKMKALKAYADKKKWGYIPTFEAFAVRPDGGADQMLDALHPGIGTGRALQGTVAEKWIKAQTKRPI